MKQTWRKNTGVFAFILLLILSLAACGGGTPAATPAPPPAPEATPAPTPEGDDGNGDDLLEITSPGDLETPGVRIAVQNGTTGHIFAEANFPEAELLIYNSNVDVIQALLVGHADAVILDSEPARNFVDRNEGRIRQLDELLTQEYYGIALQLDSPYTELFNAALEELRENGTLYNLIDYWVNEDPGASRYESPAGTTHPNGVLVMGTSADFPPFEFYEGDQIVGLDPDIARAIGDILGYEIEILDMDFDVVILAVQQGQVDFGMAGMTVTAERLQQVDFSQGYFLSGQSIIVRVS